MRLYRIKWYVNGELSQTKEEAFWCKSDLEETYDKQIIGIENIMSYEYEYIKDINLPENLFDFSNYKC